MKETNIAWTNSTGGPWLLCTEVSPGCANCYARELAERKLEPLIRKAFKAAGLSDWQSRPVWGKTAPRVLTKGFWKAAIAMNRKAPDGHKWFPSLIDWLDDMPAGIIDQDGNILDPLKVFGDFVRVIYDTPRLTWILCTKRPEAWKEKMARLLTCVLTHQPATDDHYAFVKWVEAWLNDTPPANVWILTTIENRLQEHRIDDLLKIPAVVHGVSAEPLLESLTFANHDWIAQTEFGNRRRWLGTHDGDKYGKAVDWLIVGGESGNDRRDCGVEAIIQTAQRGVELGCRVFVKQDCSMRPGAKGRIPDEVWSRKQFPDRQMN